VGVCHQDALNVEDSQTVAVSVTQDTTPARNSASAITAETPATTRNPLSEIADAELVRRFTETANEPAFRELVHRYTPLVMGVALRTTHDQAGAEDVLQATFLVLVEKASSLQDPSEVASWLHGVALRIARRLVDKRHRHRERPHPEEGVIMDPEPTTDPFQRVCETRDHDVLGEELQRLPEKLRTPLVLRYLEDLTNDQVAKRLGLKVSTVEGRLKRGKKELRRRLARRGVTLGAAMLVWNMTQQAVAATPVTSLAEQAAATALAWETPTPAVAPPTETAISLARQETLAMSTLKLTTAGTLAGTVLLATSLLVAMTAAEEGNSSHAVAAERSTIDTTVSDVADPTDLAVPPGSIAAPQDSAPAEQIAGTDDPPEGQTANENESATDPDDRILTIYQLKSFDAEKMARLILPLLPGASTGATTGLTVAADVAKKSLIVRGKKSEVERLQALMEAIDVTDEREALKKPRLDANNTGDENHAEIADNNGDAQIADRKATFAKPDGVIRHVDETSRTVWLNLGEQDGVRLHLTFGVYAQDDNSGTRKVSDAIGNVEVVRMLGDHLCEARIFGEQLENPISPGDVVYSSSWSPGAGDEAASAPTGAVETADSKAEPAKEIKVFQLQHASALSTSELLNELFRARIPDPNQSTANQPKIVSDSRTNVIVASGDSDQLDEIEAILMRLDQPSQPGVIDNSTRRGDSAKYKLGPGDVHSGSAESKESASRFDMTSRSAAEQRIQRTLQTPTVPAFDEYTLDKVLFVLGEQHDFQYVIDKSALEEQGLSLDAHPVTLNLENSPTLGDSVTVGTVLDLVLRQASGGSDAFGESELTYVVKQGLLVITTREVSRQTMEIRTYDLRPFQEASISTDVDDVTTAIKTMTGDDTWAEQGGRGALVQGATTLTIRQSPLVHREIEALLEQMLHAAEQTQPSKSPSR